MSITTRYNHSTLHVLLIVRDEGVGIAAEHLSRLTDPLSFDSSPGAGTTVTLALTLKSYAGLTNISTCQDSRQVMGSSIRGVSVWSCSI